MASSSVALQLFKLSFLLSLLPNSALGVFPDSRSAAPSGTAGVLAPSQTCSQIECPSYDVIDDEKGYEIRRYNSVMWISTAPINNSSFVGATNTGFLQLFDYIQGKNIKKQRVEMTAPVITQVLPSAGPLCDSSFVTSFFIPKENQANPPPAKDLQVQKWTPTTYVAVRRFSGFVADDDVAQEAAALRASLKGTKWGSSIDKTHGPKAGIQYIVAQYNSPFEIQNRVNEIWLDFQL